MDQMNDLQQENLCFEVRIKRTDSKSLQLDSKPQPLSSSTIIQQTSSAKWLSFRLRPKWLWF